jgi:predicted aspartyl protease
MKRLVTYTGVLFFGMALGWWLRDLAPQAGPPQPQARVSSTNKQAVMPSLSTLPAAGPSADAHSTPVRETNRSPEAADFEQLLNEQAFEQAVAYYENALEIDDGYQALLKPSLEDYLSASLYPCANSAFLELVELWLDAYYDDISILLLLAENQRLCSSPEEAARTLQIARTYAAQPGSQAAVTDALTRLITATDNNLSQQKDWIALLGFFEFLQVIDLSTNTSQLRTAALYQLLGEYQRSQDLLSVLKDRDDRLDTEWTAALNLQWTKSAEHSSGNDLPAHAVPLTRRGDHFLVSTLISDANRVVLMIDTGASVTTLSRRSFNQIDRSDFSYVGSRLFSTPNGMTQGDVYQATSIGLGNTRLGASEIAVLDFESAEGVDGLLGMNVLRHYRFEIDQDENVLYLRPRL